MSLILALLIADAWCLVMRKFARPFARITIKSNEAFYGRPIYDEESLVTFYRLVPYPFIVITVMVMIHHFWH